MSNDRFLTRVFDKQEKKMIYVGDQFLLEKELYIFYTFDRVFIYIERVNISIDRPSNGIIRLPFADRFIPMLCSVLKDKNGKLSYAGDILRFPHESSWEITNFASYEVFFHDNDSCMSHIGFQMDRVFYHGSVSGGWVPNFTPQTVSKMEIIGNKFENPELTEEHK